ncbi:unnamed protein product, partial [Bubo scandiacus]
ERQWKKKQGCQVKWSWLSGMVLNKTPCFKGSRAAGECLHPALYGCPLNVWKDTGQMRSDLWVGKTCE